MRDNGIYTSEMMKSVWDKAFFMDKIPGVKCVVDFGCADGAMIRMLAPMFPDITFFGYDYDVDMITRANAACDYDNVAFYDHAEFPNMIQLIKDCWSGDSICINFSSVLHEVFSFGETGKEVINMLVSELQPKYITIRDMYYHGGPYARDLRMADVMIKNKIEEKYCDDFVKEYGAFAGPRSTTHFLMKYQWKDNGWEEEMEEDYYSWNVEDLIKILNNDKSIYDVVFETHYQLPYLREKWFKEYGFMVPDAHTHAQFILRRF